jgi:hypothetical protein
MSSGSSKKKKRRAAEEAKSKAKKQERAMSAQIASQRAELERQQSDLAMRTQAGLRARRRGAAVDMRLGTDDQESTLG